MELVPPSRCKAIKAFNTAPFPRIQCPHAGVRLLARTPPDAYPLGLLEAWRAQIWARSAQPPF